MSRGTRAALVMIIVAVAAISGVAGYRMWNYTQHDPSFCRSCHVMESSFEAWQKSVHSSVECHACHVQSIRENVEQLVKFVVLRPDTIGKHAEVDYAKCGACHLSHDPRWAQVAETAGHKVHFQQRGFQCVGCHSKGIHRFVRPIDACRECHTGVVMKAVKMEALHCTACHNFLAPGGELRVPSRQQCLDCHLAMQATVTYPEHGKMRFACNQCHKPHEHGRPASADCGACHQMAAQGLHGRLGHANCVACHRPHAWAPSERAGCQSCHSDKGDHYAAVKCAACHSFAAAAPPPPSG